VSLEKENAISTQASCNCRLAEGKQPHPDNYRGCGNTKEELQKKISQKTPKIKTGGVFSSNLNTPGVSFAAALGGSTAHNNNRRRAKFLWQIQLQN
jgi:hypothetical protein